MVAAEQLTDKAVEQSVQTFSKTTYEQNAAMWFYAPSYDILPAWGTRQRDMALREFWRAVHGTMYQGAISGIAKKIAATPWEIKGPPSPKWKTSHFQAILQNANFGAGWDDFVTRFILDYLTQDFGSIIEIIAPGDPSKPLNDHLSITGISTLSSLSCGATGNPEYPLVYQSRSHPDGIHVLHRERALRFVDMPDTDEMALGTGLSALSRMISPANVQILMGRYQNEKLNDLPMPGIVTVKGMTQDQFNASLRMYEADRKKEGQSIFRSIMTLTGIDPDNPPAIEFTSFSQLPDNFDFEKYMNLHALQIANALNIDVQEFWALQAKSLGGTGTQSEILHTKSERKLYAHLYGLLERAMNIAMLPKEFEFKFKFQDREGDKADAERAKIWVEIVSQLSTILDSRQQAQLLANNVEQFADVLLNKDGQVEVKLPDSDVRPEDQPVVGDGYTTIGTTPAGDQTTADDAAPVKKAISKEGYVYLSFADNAELVKLQRQMKEKYPSLELTKPEELHITIAYADYIDNAAFGEAFNLAAKTGADDLSVYSAVVDTFEPEYESNTPLILRVNPLPSLLSFQRVIRKAIEAQGVKVSAYTKSWIPHITLGYSPKPIDVEALEIEFNPELDPTELCWARDDYEVIYREPTVITKQKDFGDTASDFGRDFYDLVQSGVDSDVNRRRFGTVARAQLRRYGTQAYKDGLEFNGVVDEDLTADDLSAITDWLAEQSEYVTNFANNVFEGRISESSISAHVDMWASKSLRDIFNRGVLAADADAMMQWHYDPSKEHCDDCKRLHGQIHRMSAWMSRDLVPGSSKLKCKGYHCGCEFRRTNKRAAGSF